MDAPFLGMIVTWPIDFAPQGWLFCEGQELQVSQYQALYSLLGNNFGGSAGRTFKLPDLRGRVVVGCNTTTSTLPMYPIGTNMGNNGANPVLPQHTHAIPNSGMTVDVSKATISASASEATVTSDGNYGLPITGESTSPTTSPTTSDYYIGTPKLANGTALNTYYKPNSAPTVTTKPTPITVTGKVTPAVSVSMKGNLNVTVAPNTVVSVTGTNDKIDVRQPGLALRYIIAMEGLYPTRG